MAQGQDGWLVAGCIKKDPLAWAELVKRYSGLITIAIENIFKKYSFHYSKSDIDDVLQNVIISIWRGEKLSTVRDKKDISYWLAAVSGNATRDYIRRKISQGDLKTISIYETLGADSIKEMIDVIPLDKPTPRDEVLRKEFFEYLKEALAGLPNKERLIVKLNLYHQKTHEDISRMTRWPIGTVSSTIRRTKEKLKQRLKKYLQEF